VKKAVRYVEKKVKYRPKEWRDVEAAQIEQLIKDI